MGLDTTHGCWHGAYSAFGRWRAGIAKAAGIPLGLMEGYWDANDDTQRVLRHALAWSEPRAGGPLCRDPNGPVLNSYVKAVNQWLPISWDWFRSDPLYVLLDHSDCDGWLPSGQCGPLADRLTELLPLLPESEDGGHIGVWRDKTQAFIDGLRLAASLGEDVGFH